MGIQALYFYVMPINLIEPGVGIKTITHPIGSNLEDGHRTHISIDHSWLNMQLALGSTRYNSGDWQRWNGYGWEHFIPEDITATYTEASAIPQSNTVEDKPFELLKALVANPMFAKDDDYELVGRAFSLTDAFEEVLKSRKDIKENVRL